MASSLEFVSRCCALPVHRLEAMYRKACTSGDFFCDQNIEEPPEETLESEAADPVKAGAECMAIIEEVQNAAANGENFDFAHGAEEVAAEMEDLPDKDQIMELLNMESPQCPFSVGAEKSPPKSSRTQKDVLPDTLAEALAMKGDPWNNIFKLVVRMRSSVGGSDVAWVHNPRGCRKASRGLNWHQLLGRLGPVVVGVFCSFSSHTFSSGFHVAIRFVQFSGPLQISPPSWPRWNEKRIAEINSELNEPQVRSRAGRMQKWQELSLKARADLELPVAEHKRIMFLDWRF